MNKEIKTVSFAYPTSDHAEDLGREDTGCYIVETGHFLEPDKELHGPFDTLREAEDFAAAMDLPWCPLYEKAALPGSAHLPKADRSLQV